MFLCPVCQRPACHFTNIFTAERGALHCITLRGSEVRTLATVSAFCALFPPAISATVRIGRWTRTGAKIIA